jgi:cytochrome c oxidase subunit IV
MDLALPAATPGPHSAQSRFHIYVQIAMILAVITGVELLLIFLPFPKPLLITGLVALSAVKFMFVIFFFMHLRWDRILCTILFFIGLVLAAGTMVALLHLFAVKDSIPLSFQP